MACLWVDLPLFIYNEEKHAKTDVCISNCSQNGDIILIQENKRFQRTKSNNIKAQLVAEAVAAFNLNNLQRHATGLLYA